MSKAIVEYREDNGRLIGRRPVGPTERSVSELASEYYAARPLNWKDWDTLPKGTKLQEEVKELVDELARHREYAFSPNASPDMLAEVHEAIMDEIADVAVTLSWIARCHDIDIEDAMVQKTEKDRGRGLKANAVRVLD